MKKGCKKGSEKFFSSLCNQVVIIQPLNAHVFSKPVSAGDIKFVRKIFFISVISDICVIKKIIRVHEINRKIVKFIYRSVFIELMNNLRGCIFLFPERRVDERFYQLYTDLQRKR